MPPSSRALRAIAQSANPLDGLIDLAKKGPVEAPGFALPKQYGMGEPPDVVEVSQRTPRDFLNSLTEDPARSQEIIDRISERNRGFGDRAVEDPDLFAFSVDNPYTVVRGKDEGFATPDDGAAGIWDSNRRVVAYSDSGDPAMDAGYNVGDLNARQHEEVHALLQPEPPSSAGSSLMERNDALSGGTEFDEGFLDRLPDELLEAQNFLPFATNKREFVNLLFNVKRMSEKLDGVDYGASLATSNQLGKRLMRGKVNYDMADDVYIDPDMLDGYERQVDYLRELYRASNEYGRAYIRDLMHKLGMVGAITAVTAGSENPLGGLADE